jgi:hypothetical protein
MSTTEERMTQRADLDEHGNVNIGPAAEMQRKWLEEQFVHEAVLRALGEEPVNAVFTAAETNPSLVAEPDESDADADADEDVDDLDVDYGA